MSRPWRALNLALVALAIAVLAAVPDAPAEDPPPAQDQRAEWHARVARNPRLLHDARAFLALPPEQQERMRKLDRDLQQLDSSTQARLGKVLERYADWMEGLPENERRQVITAPDRHLRLKKIRELREDQWLRRQPRLVRNRLEAVRAAQLILPRQAGGGLAFVSTPLLAAEGKILRSVAIARLRQEEHKRRKEWQVALRPTRIADLDKLLQTYVNEYLKPMLTASERERLEKAEGRWPLFPQTLVELADRHPLALQGAHGPTSFKDLPTKLQLRINQALAKGPKDFKGPKGGDGFWRGRLKGASGRWPGFALAVTDLAYWHKIPMPNEFELWPLRSSDLSLPVRKFVEEKLRPRLNKDEGKLLRDKEGKWPEYPHTIQELAQRYSLKVPWQTLPGPPEDWDAYRTKPQGAVGRFPDLPQHRLRDFALLELSPQGRALLKGSWSDPRRAQRLTEELFKRRPAEQKRPHQQDPQHAQRRKGGPHLVGLPPPRPGAPRWP
ncbi:MAG: hypothetical protein L0Z62_09730 [Gemmataceae bacterium]|nr:hypothetical protein [Gemmataceae bacterium]